VNSPLKQATQDASEDLRIVARRLGKRSALHPAVLLDMSSVALLLLRSSIALRRAVGSSLGTRSALKWVFRIDVWTDDIGGGLTLPHPFNIVIGAGVRIEPGCTIMHNTTIQHASGTVIEQGAMLGAGSVVLKNVRIGRRAACGANSVVSRDVPDDTTVVGAPARPINRRPDPKAGEGS
jgi:serine acetyltransferase